MGCSALWKTLSLRSGGGMDWSGRSLGKEPWPQGWRVGTCFSGARTVGGWVGVMEKSGTGHDVTEEACVGIDFCIKTLLSHNHKLRKK